MQGPFSSFQTPMAGIPLDIHTLYFSLAVVAGFFGLAFLLFRFIDTRARGVLYWGSGYLLISLGLILVLYRPLRPLEVNRLISALSFVIAVLFVDRGIRRRLGFRRLIVVDGAFLFLFALVYSAVAFKVHDPQVSDRILLVALALGVGRGAYHLVRCALRAEGRERYSFFSAAAFVGVMAIILAILAVFVSTVGPVRFPLASHPVHALMIPALILVLIGAGMAVFWAHYAGIYKDAYEAATSDTLTGLKNRYYAEPELERLFVRAQREGRDFGCMMIDIDYFKRINDNHGHLVGDEVLKSVAERISHAVRTYDLVARIGGEEFVVAEFDISPQALFDAARRIHGVVRAQAIAGIDVTVSIGVASLTEADERVNDVINRADEALYSAKRAGRDRVEVERASSA